MKKSRAIGELVTADGNRYPVKIITRREWRAVFRPYGAELGYIAFAWNQLHVNLSHLFKAIVSPDHPRLAKAIWYVADNDFLQRKMLRAAVEELESLPAAHCDEILWVLNQIDSSLRHKRNDALHAPLIFIQEIVDDAIEAWFEANKFTLSPRAKALDGKNLIDEFEQYGAVTEALSGYVVKICNAIDHPHTHAWPKRPSLPDAHRKKIRKGSHRRKIAKLPLRPSGSSKA